MKDGVEMKRGTGGYQWLNGWQVVSKSLAVVSNLRWYKCPNSTNVAEEPKVHIRLFGITAMWTKRY